MKINFKQIEAFVTVAELLSFSRAAERLNTTQPSISSRVSSLEAQLNVTLMERDSATVRLTPAGESLLSKAHDIMRALDTFVTTAGQEHLFEGTLRLGVTEMIVHSWLGNFLTAVKEKYPSINVDLTVDLSANLTTALTNKNIDLALQSGPFVDNAHGAIELGQFPLIWVSSPSLESGDQTLSPERLTTHSILTHAKGTQPYEQLRQHLAQTALAGSNVQLVPSTNLAACLQMTCDGLGIACLPEAMVRDQLKTGQLIKLDYHWVPDPLAFSARFNADSSPLYVTDAAAIANMAANKYKG